MRVGPLCVPSVSGGGPSGLSVTEETAVSLAVGWVPPNAHVLRYRVSYTALTAAEAQDRTVSRPRGVGKVVPPPSAYESLTAGRLFRSPGAGPRGREAGGA